MRFHSNKKVDSVGAKEIVWKVTLEGDVIITPTWAGHGGQSCSKAHDFMSKRLTFALSKPCPWFMCI